MIKIENTDVYGWEATIRGMRNPKNSWDKSDTILCPKNITANDCNGRATCEFPCPRTSFEKDFVCIGKNDLKLMKTLAAAGNDHGKFMRMITVTCDIIAPLYWWKEFDTYKVGTVANSCSTMHKIADKEFTEDDFSFENLSDEAKTARITEIVLDVLNTARAAYLATKDKTYWWDMIQLLPCSYNQRRTVQLNYAVLKNMYHARRAHKLNEWIDFCKWIEALPYAKELICFE